MSTRRLTGERRTPAAIRTRGIRVLCTNKICVIWGREVHLAPHGWHYAGDGWDGWDFQQPSLSRARRTVRGRAKSRLS
jgi:hypothetical protein